jgi:hypothetical protein
MEEARETQKSFSLGPGLSEVEEPAVRPYFSFPATAIRRLEFIRVVWMIFFLRKVWMKLMFL